MTFAYVAYDRSGKSVEATVDGEDLMSAREHLRRQGLFVSSIQPAGARAAAQPQKSASGRRRGGTGQRLRSVSMFARQLHVLVSSGTPLAQAIAAIERQLGEGPFRAAVQRIASRIDEGQPLSEAMRQVPHFFDATCQSLAAAGEASGNMGIMLQRLADMTRKQLVTRNNIIGALVYPAALVLIGVLVLAMMLLFVLPRFEGLFEQLDTALPPTTRVLIGLSHALQDDWWLFLPATLAAVGAGVWWLRSERGLQWFDRALLSAPKLGTLARSVMTARVARTLGTLLECKVPLLEALQLTRQSVPNREYAELLDRAEEAVGRGEPVSAVLSEGDLLSSCVQEALRNGEQSGRIGDPLLQMAAFLEEENELVIKSVTRLLEPAILCALGAVVGFIAISMFLPLFDLVASASGGAH